MEARGEVKMNDSEGRYPCSECDAEYVFSVMSNGDIFAGWEWWNDDDVVCESHRIDEEKISPFESCGSGA